MQKSLLLLFIISFLNISGYTGFAQPSVQAAEASDCYLKLLLVQALRVQEEMVLEGNNSRNIEITQRVKAPGG